MSGDYSRQRFNPKNDFSGVLMQQGRVQLDADWNELVEILDRRRRAETTDTIGRCAVPRQTPDGFLIQITSGTLAIGRGRIYVDGLLAENAGAPPLEFDPVLAEERGTLPLPYLEQPYLPNASTVAPLPQEGGPHLLYIDVWQREVTYLERPDLIEPALGVDTTTRLQTVWQVRPLPNIGDNVTCATPDDQIPGWPDIVRPSAGRLSTEAVGVLDPADPCLIPPSGGYRGLENRLYRVEIQDAGPVGTATFKWSRDNASIATSVTAIPTLDTLAVVRTGRDAVLRFNPGDWVEITDDWREFALQPGLIRQVQDVDDATQTITLTAPLPAGEFPTNAQGQTEAARHTRVRRWDQQGEVRDTSGNLLVDLDAAGSNGVIPVPPANTSLILEDGVQITFSTASDGGAAPDSGSFRVGDYWVFAARTADAAVEQLQEAPPRGVHHHYGRLAIVNFPDTVTDCRVLWPPEFGGEGCDCSVCVTVESHNSGALTIQHAIDQVKAEGGTVCLGVGQYNLREEPIRITQARSIHLKGQGWKTQLVHPGRGPAILIEGSQNATVEELSVVTALAGDTIPQVALRNCIGATLQRCLFLNVGNNERGSLAIGCAGVLTGTVIRENVIVASFGIGNMEGQEGDDVPQMLPLSTAGLRITDNFLFCVRRGISLEGMTLHTAETQISGNVINNVGQGGIAAQGAIVARGWVAPGFGFDIRHNTVRAGGPGIVAGVDGARISDNDISTDRGGQNNDGIILDAGLTPGGLDDGGLERCQVLGNRIMGIAGNGITIRTRLRSAMIKQNIIENAGGGGIVMAEGGSAETLHVENNQLRNIGLRANETGESAVGIRLLRAGQAFVGQNAIHGVGRDAVQSPSRAGIQVIATSLVQITGNEVSDIGPPEFVKEAAGIEVLGSFARADVAGNDVRRSRQSDQTSGVANWYALRIRGGVLPVTAIGAANAEPAFISVDNDIGFTTGFESLFGVFGALLLKLPRGREMVAVRGNVLEANGRVPAVEISGGGAFIFSDNQCLLSSPARLPVVEIRGGAIIANSNVLQGMAQVPALRLQVPDNGPFTVTGNITSGNIEINGAPLNLPWAPLNVIAS